MVYWLMKSIWVTLNLVKSKEISTAKSKKTKEVYKIELNIKREFFFENR